LYSHDISERNQRNNPKIWDPRFYYLRILKQSLESVFQREFADRTTLLDYGCGASPYYDYITNLGVKYLRADLKENPNIDFEIISNILPNIPDNSLDYVLSTQVLEHVEDYSIYLKEAYRVLKPGGKLVLSTHGYWMFHPDPNDFWRWTSQGLNKIILEAGFKESRFTGVLGRAASGFLLFQDGLMFKLPKPLKVIFTSICQLAISILDKVESKENKLKDACTYITVSIK